MRKKSLKMAVVIVAGLAVANVLAAQAMTATSASQAPVHPSTAQQHSTALQADAVVGQVNTITATTDVEAAMKKMGFVYKKAMQATDLNSFRQHATEFAQIVSSVQQYQFAADKQQVFMQGLDKVQQQTQQALAAADLASAQQQFAQIDQLRKQYHKERSVSFWQLLFGG